jgi:hypothetical protein
VAQAGSIADAAANTAGQSARVAVTTTVRTPGMSISTTQTGAFDFAHSRGVLRVMSAQPAGKAGATVRFTVKARASIAAMPSADRYHPQRMNHRPRAHASLAAW